MESHGPEIERMARHVPLLRREVDRLMQDLIRLQNFTAAHPDAPHPAAPGGAMSWDVILARFVDLERELRMLNERAADARRSSLRQLLVVPQLPSDRRRRVEPLARQQAESLPLRLAVKLHAQMEEHDRVLRLPRKPLSEGDDHMDGAAAGHASHASSAEARPAKKRARNEEDHPEDSSSKSSSGDSSSSSSSGVSSSSTSEHKKSVADGADSLAHDGAQALAAHNATVSSLIAVLEKGLAKGLPFMGR